MLTIEKITISLEQSFPLNSLTQIEQNLEQMKIHVVYYQVIK